MHSVIVVIHLIVALGLVTLILLQRSEGGALGMGGGGGGAFMSGRAAGNVLSLATRWLGLAFFITSVALTVFPAVQPNAGTVVDAVDFDTLTQDADEPSALIPPDDGAATADTTTSDTVTLGTDDSGADAPAAASDDAADDEPVIPLDDE